MKFKNELQDLENALLSQRLEKYSVLVGSDKRYCLFDNRNRGIIGNLDYEAMYHFIIGYGTAMSRQQEEIDRLRSIINELADKIKAV